MTDSGHVFACGQNNKGQLGLGHNVDVLAFQVCPSLTQKIRNIACGWDFTLLLTGEEYEDPEEAVVIHTLH